MPSSEAAAAGAPPAGPDTAVRNYPLLLKRYRRLLEVSRTLSSTLDLPHLLRVVTQAATEVTDTEAASILLLDPHSGQLRFEASTDPKAASMEQIVVPIASSIAGNIFTSGKPMIIADAASDPRHFRQVDDALTFVTKSILGVPLFNKNKPFGVLQALNKTGGKSFTQDDVETIEALAAQAAVAIINARLFQQSDLIAELVHELRTPLAALSATSHLLLRPDLPPERRAEFVRTIQNETNRLTSMTTEFLDLARLESGRVRFERAPFALAALVRECEAVVRPQADSRGVAVRSQVPLQLPPIDGDRAKIKQVTLNLLTNAVKYNRDGGAVHITAELIGEAVKVAVRDTGRGIPPEALPRVFERFYRVPDRDGWTQGTGLGLAIAKWIVEAHGGRMTVESAVNVGTTFAFTLPVAKG